jgi:hypothetical protein
MFSYVEFSAYVWGYANGGRKVSQLYFAYIYKDYLTVGVA